MCKINLKNKQTRPEQYLNKLEIRQSLKLMSITEADYLKAYRYIAQ